MRYHIDTIPVWDAAKIDGECLLCALQRRVELQQIEYSLGASVMEPDVRIQVNKKGFCQHHQLMLFKGDNRLADARIAHDGDAWQIKQSSQRHPQSRQRQFVLSRPSVRQSAVTRQGDGSRRAGA